MAACWALIPYNGLACHCQIPGNSSIRWNICHWSHYHKSQFRDSVCHIACVHHHFVYTTLPWDPCVDIWSWDLTFKILLFGVVQQRCQFHFEVGFKARLTGSTGMPSQKIFRNRTQMLYFEEFWSEILSYIKKVGGQMTTKWFLLFRLKTPVLGGQGRVKMYNLNKI